MTHLVALLLHGSTLDLRPGFPNPVVPSKSMAWTVEGEVGGGGGCEQQSTSSVARRSRARSLPPVIRLAGTCGPVRLCLGFADSVARLFLVYTRCTCAPRRKIALDHPSSC